MVNMKEASVGLLFFGSLIALGLLTIWLSNFTLFETRYPYTIWFDQANELAAKDDVLIMGNQQGTVVRVMFHEAPIMSDQLGRELWVSVDVLMDVPLILKEDYKIRIRNANLLGGKVMEIQLGTKEKIDPYKVRLVGIAVPDPIQAISEFVETSKPYIRNTLEKVDNLVSNVSGWSDRISRGEGTLGRVIYSDSLANNVESLVANLEKFAADLRSDRGAVGYLLNNPQAREDVRRVLDELSNMAADLSEGKGTVGKLFKSDELHDRLLSAVSRIDDLAGNVNSGKGLAGKLFTEQSDQAFKDLAKVLANARDISDQIREGKGLLSTLIYDDQLAAKLRSAGDNLAKAASDIEEIVADVKAGKGAIGYVLRNPELAKKLEDLVDALLHSIEDAREAAPIVSLGSFLFGAI